MIAEVTLLKQVVALSGLSPAQLTKKWRELFDDEPPDYDKRAMVRKLAHRLQELSYGGMTERCSERMKIRIRHEAMIGQPPSKQDNMPVTGTRLLREWKGVEHCVTVMVDGFEYLGRPYGSLSAVARAITGTRWNGWVFFGVRRKNSGVSQ